MAPGRKRRRRGRGRADRPGGGRPARPDCDLGAGDRDPAQSHADRPHDHRSRHQQGTRTAGACTATNSSRGFGQPDHVDYILNNAANVLYPYVKPKSGTNPVTGTNMSNMTMVVSEINVDSSGTTATVQWSEPMPSHGTALATTAHAVTLPSSGVGSRRDQCHHGHRHLHLYAAGDRRGGHDHGHDLPGAPPVVVHEAERRS